MKRNFFSILFLIFISLVAVVSCINRKPQDPVIITKTKETIKTVRDTTYVVEADSTFYHALIECVNGKPVLREPKVINPKNKDSGLQPVKVTLDGNNLTVEANKIIQKLHKEWEELYVKEHEQKPIYIKVPVEVEKPLTLWQKTQIWFGRIFMGILTILLIIGVLRWKRIL